MEDKVLTFQKGEVVDYIDSAAPEGFQRNAVILSDSPVEKNVLVIGIGFVRKTYWPVAVELTIPLPPFIGGHSTNIHRLEIEESRIKKKDN